MADDLINALQQSNRSASVLQGIANPPQINPLAAITAGNQAAQAEFTTQKMQADRAAGQAFLNSIDPNTGKPNQEQLLRNLKDDRTTAFAAQRSAQEGQTLDTGTYNLHSAKLAGVSSALSELLSRYPGGVPAEAALDLIKKQGALHSITPEMMADLTRQFGNDPHENSKNITQLLFRNLSNQQILERTYGTRQMVDANGVVYDYNRPPPGVGGTIATGKSPEPGSVQKTFRPHDDKGQIPQNPDGSFARPPEGTVTYQEVIEPTTNAPGVPRGSPPRVMPGTGSSTAPPVPPGTIYNAPGRGNQIAPIFDPVTGQRLTPTTTPPPMPPGARPDGPGRRSALGGGVPVASANSLQVPETGAPGARMPMTASNVADIQAGMAQARANPRPAGTQTAYDTRPPMLAAPPQGQQKEVEASVQHASDARGRTLTYQRDIQPIEGAITALAGADTGRASETLNSIRANIQDLTPGFLQRMLPHSLTDPEARKSFEEANKYLEQIKLAAPGGSRSDAGNASAGAATPSVHISNAAAREVSLAILAQRRMEHAGTMLFNQSGKPGAAFDRHMGEWMTQVDPRAFVADKMKPEERAAYVKSIGGPSTPDKPNPAYEQYKKSYQDAVASGVIRH